MLFRSLAILLVSFTFFSSYAQSDLPLNSSKSQRWQVRPEADSDDAANWVEAIVPGTVFASYVAAGLEKDPNFGDNIYKVDKAKYDRNFWYQTTFDVPADYNKEKIWLCFQGINRKAEVYLNNQLIGHLDGFMHRGRFDVSKVVTRKGKNQLRVLVYLPKQPLGNYASPTYISSGGWDWMPYVPGLNMGITDQVYLSNTAALTIQDPWVRANLPTNARADLSVAVEVKNTTDKQQEGYIHGVISPGNITFSQRVSVQANDVSEVKLDKRFFPQLVVNNPKLWWPNGYGDPNLYTCKLSIKIGDQVSDRQELKFGIKRYSYDTLGNVLHLAINGSKVFVKGGNWGMSEYMLRARGDEYDLKVRLHKEMNFNMVRNWMGSTTDAEFYEACDKYGIMVWDDFWLNANPNLPRDLNTFNANVIEKIKRVRNHPSIAVWCGENEGWPEAPLNGWLKENLKTFDGGERYYQANSHADNLTGSGPWASFDPRYYFTAYPTGMGGNSGWGFRTEIGTAVFTNVESFKKFMPADKLWPRNEMWNQHFFGQLAFNAGPDQYDESIHKRYGVAKSIEDYCRKAQFVNIETNKAMYEGWQDKIWEDASGIMTWMSQSAYPSLVWQTYDYYYDLTGAFWGAKKACEPLHIQWNPATDAVKVVNTTGMPVHNLTAEVAIYNLDGKKVDRYSLSSTLDAPASSATESFKIGFDQSTVNIALNKTVYASSTSYGEPAFVADGNAGTRWSSKSRDDEWIYIDLGEQKEVNGVGLTWEDAYAKSFKIQVSDDAKSWTDVYSTNEGRPGAQRIMFSEVNARYVRIFGIERGSYWGYSLYDFEVYEGNVKSKDLTDVHFIKLSLKDQQGKVVSDNFYWRGNKRKDFTALNTLPKVNLKVNTKVIKQGNQYILTADITNPTSAPAVAFGIRVQAVKASNGEQILPAIMNDNYFSLLKGETKTVRIEFNAADLGKDSPRLLVEPYNNFIAK